MRREWLTTEVQYVKENLDRMQATHLAEHLGRSAISLYRMVQRHGLQDHARRGRRLLPPGVAL